MFQSVFLGNVLWISSKENGTYLDKELKQNWGREASFLITAGLESGSFLTDGDMEQR